MERTLFSKWVWYQQAFNSSCSQSFLWAGNTTQMFPSVGLICVLENSSIQMQNMPPNNYVCSLPLSPVHLAYYSPPLRFFPYVPTAPLPLLFQPILLDSNMNISYILTPALVFSLKRFRLAPSTTPPSDPVPRAAPASSRTFYRLCQELARGFMLTVTPPQIYLSPTEKSRTSRIQLLQEKQDLPLLLKGESSHWASHPRDYELLIQGTKRNEYMVAHGFMQIEIFLLVPSEIISDSSALSFNRR